MIRALRSNLRAANEVTIVLLGFALPRKPRPARSRPAPAQDSEPLEQVETNR